MEQALRESLRNVARSHGVDGLLDVVLDLAELHIARMRVEDGVRGFETTMTGLAHAARIDDGLRGERYETRCLGLAIACLVDAILDRRLGADFERAGELIARGAEAAEAALPELRNLLAGDQPSRR